MKIDRDAVCAAFAAYVQAYDPSDPKIRLKIDHTYRVAALCAQLAESIALPDGDVDLAWLAGMLHDVGRFEQVRRWGTFNDALSVDHAALGADLLFCEGHIRDYLADPAEDDLLETAVRLHSAYRLPDSLTPRRRTFCDLLRDADKIDILRVNIDTPLTAIYNVSEEALAAAAFSPAVLEAFRAQHAVEKCLRRTPADALAGLLALTFELVYPASLRLVREQGYLDRLLHFPTRNPDTARQLLQMRAALNEYFCRRGTGPL